MTSKHARVVWSAHLVLDGEAELSEFEYGLIVANNACSVWCVGWTAAATVEIPVAASLANLVRQLLLLPGFASILPAAKPIYRCGQIQ